jgi:hypothetical protein
MTLIVLTVVVVALLTAALAIYLFILGILLNRAADNLADCARSVRVITGQVAVIGPAVGHINRTGGELVGALPLLYEGAEQLISQSGSPPPADAAPAPVPAPQSVGYLDT